MVSFEEFSAWVNVDGHKAQEYGVEVSEVDKTVTCWIASEEGKAFEVCWDDSSKQTATTGKLYIDGNECSYKRMDVGRLQHTTVKGVRISAQMRRPFVFSRVKTTDDESIVTASASVETGEIRVVLTRAIIRSYRTVKSWKPAYTIPAPQTFHEKAKKAIDHQTSFGDAILAPVRKRSREPKVNEYGGPVATFCFRYRPLGMLQANGIAPPPTPQTRKRPSTKQDPDPEVIDITGDSDDEIERLEARLKLLKDKRAANPHKKVKMEPKVKTEVKTEPLREEFIDLT
ncbi:hypothetical protein Moror_15205 [Moniliophthora roreri MCA 2997]|uniref:DUF7918 domain-containing protein n=1 Tax=Moniliophthora roreri (strain MCA 2997) TaxID=1381753 RepID=V2X2P9_MONRO|nr:hypothetical protein Moror_15205 [Moniliophthora roreri MCA 2997]